MNKKGDFFKPDGWRDAERMVEHFEKMEQQNHSLKPSAIARKTEIEYNKMFYIGVLFGMALEAGKEYPLEHRRQF